jgi:hypothetical protein
MGGGVSGSGGTRNNVVVKIGMVGDAQVDIYSAEEESL